MSVEARTQFLCTRQARGVARRHGHIDGRQIVLVQAKGFSREALDSIARHGRAEGARRDGQP